jgi:hypothetical protein
VKKMKRRLSKAVVADIIENEEMAAIIWQSLRSMPSASKTEMAKMVRISWRIVKKRRIGGVQYLSGVMAAGVKPAQRHMLAARCAGNGGESIGAGSCNGAVWRKA